MKNAETRNAADAARGPLPEAGGEDEALWSLLGKARPVTVSPFFARDVLREVRKPVSAWTRFMAWPWRFAPAAATAVLLLGVTVFQITGERSVPAMKHSADRKDYEVINNLDTLIAAEESSLWLDDSDQ